jgi:hypothetical protein
MKIALLLAAGLGLAASHSFAAPKLIKVTPAWASADDEGTVVKMIPGESSGRKMVAASEPTACAPLKKPRRGRLERQKS